MISIVIPAFNEENAITETVAEIRRVIASHNVTDFKNYEIIIVNDGSTDSTGKIIENLDVTVINHPHQIGYGRSLKDGIRLARFDTIVITDAESHLSFHRST